MQKIIALAIIVATLSPIPGMAGEAGFGTLTEAKIRKCVPVLKKLAAGLDRVNAANKRMEAHKAKIGEVDPLEDITTHWGKPPLPKGAVYQPACSRALTAIEGGGFVTAVFGFGKKVDCGTLKFIKTAENPYSDQKCGKEYEKAHKLFEAVDDFYEERGGAGNPDNIVLASGEHGRTLQIQISLYNPSVDPALSEDAKEKVLKACSSTHSGLTLFLRYSPAEDMGAAVSGELPQEEINEAMTVAALLNTAREDAAFLEAGNSVEDLTRDMPPDLKAVYGDRERNARVYMKIKGELDPILDQLGRSYPRQ